MMDKKWNATTLLFSGRQNPQWELTPAQQKNWMLLWKQAPLHNEDVKQPSILGYTGCRLQYDEHSRWQLYNGCISFFEKDKVFSKKDEERQMEMFLLNTAPEEVKEVLREMKVI
ncbi:MAG: hypothetical protein JNM14_11195 [Ferruginibacter sp.]|nr:hypothetical protein [Ferruginibacter sp.]